MNYIIGCVMQLQLLQEERSITLIKGDNAAKYPDFKNVLAAFKRNDIYKFQLVTSPEAAPAGTELYKVRQAVSSPSVE